MFRAFIFIAIALMSTLTDGFTVTKLSLSRMSVKMLQSTEGDGNDAMDLPGQQSDAQRNQERLMEKLSLEGADRISSMPIPERAKRAMLAEAIEDRIFELTDKLEALFNDEGILEEQNREKAVEIAKETKGLQIQYEELVSGKPSSVLQSLESVMGTSKDNED